jgi:hypothetical protein
MNINCEKIVESFLLNKNPLYVFNFPISLIISIIVFGFATTNKWSNNSYILQILIPIVVLIHYSLLQLLPVMFLLILNNIHVFDQLFLSLLLNITHDSLI